MFQKMRPFLTLFLLLPVAFLFHNCTKVSFNLIPGPNPAGLQFSQIPTQPVAAQTSNNIQWMITNPAVAPTNQSVQPNLALRQFAVDYTADQGQTWQSYNYDSASSLSAVSTQSIVNKTFSYVWNTPVLNEPQIYVRVTYTDEYGVVSSVISSPFAVEAASPVVQAININSGASLTKKNYVSVQLQAYDPVTNISAICLKKTPLAPVPTDTCWRPINTVGSTSVSNTTFSAANVPFVVGFVPGQYSVFAWVQNQVGHISQLSANGSGTLTVDYKGIGYYPDPPPQIINVFATNTNTPQNPPLASELQVSAGSPVSIKWKVSNVGAGLGSNPINIYYTTNDLDYTLINSGGLPNTPSSGCTVDGVNETGCYVWNSNLTGYFRIRVALTDTDGITATASSSPLNLNQIRFLAGNTEMGTGGSATTAIFQPSSLKSTAVLDDGRIFVLEPNGLMLIDPNDGLKKLLIKTTGSYDDDRSSFHTLSQATLASPYNIYADYSNNIVIRDFDRIRVLNTTNMTIHTLIGGGSQSLTIATNNSLAINPGDLSLGNSSAPLILLPNGDIWFVYGSGPLVSNTLIVKYTAASAQITNSLAMTGTTNTWATTANNPNQDITQCYFGDLGAVLDVANSQVKRFILRAQEIPVYVSSQCLGPLQTGESNAYASLDPSTGKTINDQEPGAINPGTGYRDHLYAQVTAKNGQLYAVSNASGVSSLTFQLDLTSSSPTYNSWNRIISNSGSGNCADGTLALQCNTKNQSLAVTSFGQVYLFTNGILKTLDENNAMVSIIGQSSDFGDGGNPLSARFGNIVDAKYWQDSQKVDHVTILDSTAFKIREIAVGGTISTLAGDGNSTTYPNTTTTAANQDVVFTDDGAPTRLQVDSSTGNIYFRRTAGVTSYLNRASDLWLDQANDGGYGPWIIGQNSTSTVYGTWSYCGPSLSSCYSNIISVDKSAGTVTTLSRTPAGVAVGGNFCGDGTSLASCLTPLAPYTLETFNDSINNSWVVITPFSSVIRTLSMDGSGTMQSLGVTRNNQSTTAQLPRLVNSWAYVHTASAQMAYYCSAGQLYKYDILKDQETALTISNISCAQTQSLVYSAQRNSLIFGYSLNGLSGVAEYVNP